MDVSGIVNKVTGALDNKLLQGIVGYAMYGQYAFHDGALGGSLRMTQALFKDPHLPNLDHVLTDLKNSPLIPFIAMAIGGWIAQELDVLPGLDKIGRLAKGYGAYGSIGIVAASMLNHMSLQRSSASKGNPAPSGYGYY